MSAGDPTPALQALATRIEGELAALEAERSAIARLDADALMAGALRRHSFQVDCQERARGLHAALEPLASPRPPEVARALANLQTLTARLRDAQALNAELLHRTRTVLDGLVHSVRGRAYGPALRRKAG